MKPWCRLTEPDPVREVDLSGPAKDHLLPVIPEDVLERYNEALYFYETYGLPDYDDPPCRPQQRQECFDCWRTMTRPGKSATVCLRKIIEAEIRAIFHRPVSPKGFRRKLGEVFSSRGLNRSDYVVTCSITSKRGGLPGKVTITIKRKEDAT